MHSDLSQFCTKVEFPVTAILNKISYCSNYCLALGSVDRGQVACIIEVNSSRLTTHSLLKEIRRPCIGLHFLTGCHPASSERLPGTACF